MNNSCNLQVISAYPLTW